MLGGLQSGTTYYLRSYNTVMEWNKPGYCVLGHSPAGIEWIQSVTVPSSAIDWGRRVPWGDVAKYQTVSISILSRRIPRYRISPSISRPTKHSDGRPAMSLTFCHISVNCLVWTQKCQKYQIEFVCFPCFFVLVHTFCLSETMYTHANLLCKLSVLLASTCCNYFRFHFSVS